MNAKLKDFSLHFTNKGGGSPNDYPLCALVQTMEHALVYKHSHIVARGTA